MATVKQLKEEIKETFAQFDRLLVELRRAGNDEKANQRSGLYAKYYRIAPSAMSKFRKAELEQILAELKEAVEYLTKEESVSDADYRACPHCNEPVDGDICYSCGEDVPVNENNEICPHCNEWFDGDTCYSCGYENEEAQTQHNEEDEAESEQMVGIPSKCSVCGKDFVDYGFGYCSPDCEFEGWSKAVGNPKPFLDPTYPDEYCICGGVGCVKCQPNNYL